MIEADQQDPDTTDETGGGTRPLHELDLRDDGDLTDFVKRLWRSGKEAKREHENRWAEQLAHMVGDQWLYYDPDARSIFHGNAEDDAPRRVRLSLNFLQGLVEARVARLSQGKITWTAIPSTDDEDDRDRSEHHSRVVKFLWRDLGMASKWVEAMFWVSVCHDCFLQSGWDPDAGSGLPLGGAEADGIPDKNSPVGQLAAQSGVDTQQQGWSDNLHVFQGANAADVVSPFEVIPDPDACSLDHCRFILRSRRRSLTSLIERYSQHADAIKNLSKTGPENEFDLYPSIYFDGALPGSQGSEQADTGLGKPLIVHELWHVPTETYPDGIRAVVCHNLVLYSGPNPYKQLPFVHLQEVPSPGCFWGTGAFRQADQVQTAINSLVSQEVEIMETTCFPMWLVDVACGFRWDDWVCEPGAVNEVNNLPGFKQLDPPRVPAYVDKLLDTYLDALEKIFGEYDVSRGQPSSQATSGRAISLLHEANERRIGPILERHQVALAAFGVQQLQIAAENWDEERTISVVGDTGERDYQAVSGRDLVGPNAQSGGLIPFDLEVAISRRRSVALVMEQLEFAIQHGVLDPRQHQQQILDALHFEGATRGPWDLAAPSRSKASQENDALLAGQPVETSFGDDDEQHIEGHSQAMITTQFDRAVGQNPMVRDGFRSHIAAHQRQAATKVVLPEVLTQLVQAEMMAKAGFTPQAEGQQQPSKGKQEGEQRPTGQREGVPPARPQQVGR